MDSKVNLKDLKVFVCLKLCIVMDVQSLLKLQEGKSLNLRLKLKNCISLGEIFKLESYKRWVIEWCYEVEMWVYHCCYYFLKVNYTIVVLLK